jgi:glycerol-3-phosphate acyltransferase PlsY
MVGMIFRDILFCAGLSYLLGSIPFGLILAHFAGLGDIRKIGSGNIGATNVLRTGKKGLAALTLLLDAGKGAAAVLFMKYYFSSSPDILGTAAVAALLGHIYPVWLKFKGGKGVATAVGCLFSLYPLIGFCAVVTWLSVAFVSRYSSLAAIMASMMTPIITYIVQPALFLTVSICAAMVLIRHKDNIKRLIAGTETMIGKSK